MRVPRLLPLLACLCVSSFASIHFNASVDLQLAADAYFSSSLLISEELLVVVADPIGPTSTSLTTVYLLDSSSSSSLTLVTSVSLNTPCSSQLTSLGDGTFFLFCNLITTQSSSLFYKFDSDLSLLRREPCSSKVCAVDSFHFLQVDPWLKVAYGLSVSSNGQYWSLFRISLADLTTSTLLNANLLLRNDFIPWFYAAEVTRDTLFLTIRQSESKYLAVAIRKSDWSISYTLDDYGYAQLLQCGKVSKGCLLGTGQNIMDLRTVSTQNPGKLLSDVTIANSTNFFNSGNPSPFATASYGDFLFVLTFNTKNPNDLDPSKYALVRQFQTKDGLFPALVDTGFHTFSSPLSASSFYVFVMDQTSVTRMSWSQKH